MTEEIYHLAEPGAWAASTEEYRSTSLEDEGFIHCSRATQLTRVARRHFLEHNDLILLAIDPEPLGDTLVYEDLDDVGEEFPHIYGPLPTSVVLTTGPYLEHLEEGLWLEARYDPDWMDRMLHPDFTEVGMSGRVHTREETIEPPEAAIEVTLPHEAYRMDLIDEDVALVRYVSHDTYAGVERHAHRTSVWVNTNDGWRLRFHQGTPLPRS